MGDMEAGDLDEFVARHTRVIALADGSRLAVRPISPADRSLLVEGFERLSAESRWNRFLRPVTRITESQLRYLTEIDYADHYAWVAVTTGDPVLGVGVARYVRDAVDAQVAEAAVVVADDWQGKGVGTVLLELLSMSAAAHGITHFRGFVAPSNTKSRAFLEDLGASGHHAEGLWVCDIPVPSPKSPIRASPGYGILVAAAAGEVEFEPPSPA